MPFLARVSRALRTAATLATTTLPLLMPAHVLGQAQAPLTPGTRDRVESLEQLRRSDERLRQPERPVRPAAPPLDVPRPGPPARPPTLSAGPTFVLRGVRVSGNTALSDETLLAAADRYLGTEVSVVELQALRRELTLLYVERGYINSGALLPDQTVRDGVVEFRIVEGTLSGIEVRGADRLSEGHVSERAFLGAGPPLNVNDLQERLQIMLESPRIEGMDVILREGVAPGESVLAVDVREADVFDLDVTFDNHRAPAIGELQLGAHARLQSFFGAAESLSLSHYRTEGLTDTVLRLEVPVTARDTTVFFSAERSEADVVEGFASEIDVESESSDYQLGVSHPLYRRVGRSLVGSVALNPRRSTTFLLGRRFSFSAGVKGGASKVVPLRLGFSWLDRDREQVVALRSTFSFGLGILGATENEGPLPDGDYFSWLGQFQWVRRLGDGGSRVIVRADAQLTPDRLLPLEKFTVGGPLSVRGYVQNQLVRDNGYSASVEARIPLFRLAVPGLSKGPRDGTLELAPFVDVGRAWNTDGPTPDPKFLSSVGVGLRWQASPRVRGSIYFAKALSNVPDVDDDSLQSDGVSFEMAVSLF